MTADETRESGVEEVLARVLTEHDDVSFDLGTPREYTRHGGWNMSCQCGHPIGDGGDDAEAMGNHRAHVAAAQAAALAPVLAAERAKALRDAADQCERDADDGHCGSAACAENNRITAHWLRDRADRIDSGADQ